jgi:hypothetical protein
MGLLTRALVVAVAVKITGKGPTIMVIEPPVWF